MLRIYLYYIKSVQCLHNESFQVKCEGSKGEIPCVYINMKTVGTVKCIHNFTQTRYLWIKNKTVYF